MNRLMRYRRVRALRRRFRCKATYNPPTHPTCQCDRYVNGATAASSVNCQKNTAHERLCYPKNYAGDKKIGAWEYYGCPEDMCARARAQSSRADVIFVVLKPLPPTPHWQVPLHDTLARRSR